MQSESKDELERVTVPHLPAASSGTTEIWIFLESADIEGS